MEDDVSNPFRRMSMRTPNIAPKMALALANNDNKTQRSLKDTRHSDLRNLLISTENKSILVVEDIDCSIEIQDRLAQARAMTASRHNPAAFNQVNQDAAKEALLYSYNTVASGFSLKLTPQQAEQISKLLGVLQVVPNIKVQLHTGPGIGRLH
ncbi:hypothetical protein OIU76_016230 [Salix suchowensis]|nr:hypothetical protein OIU76_016230 [Salix suchowensis]